MQLNLGVPPTAGEAGVKYRQGLVIKVQPIPVLGIGIRLILRIEKVSVSVPALHGDSCSSIIDRHCIASAVSRIISCMVSLVPSSGSAACPVGATSGATTDGLCKVVNQQCTTEIC